MPYTLFVGLLIVILFLICANIFLWTEYTYNILSSDNRIHRTLDYNGEGPVYHEWDNGNITCNDKKCKVVGIPGIVEIDGSDVDISDLFDISTTSYEEKKVIK